MKTFTLSIILSLTLFVVGCNRDPVYDTQTMTAIQPCMSMGFPPAQCAAAFQQAGRPYGNDTNWLGTVAAFAAGAAANHWWNRQSSYVYHPEYLSQPDYYSRNYSQPNRTWVTPQVGGIQNTVPNITQPLVEKSAPIKNTQQLIPGQKVQPLFQPNVIVENGVKATPPTVNQAFRPIQVAPIAKAPIEVPKQVAPTAQTFRPIQVAPSVSTVRTQSAPAVKSFSPVRVRPASSSSSKKK